MLRREPLGARPRRVSATATTRLIRSERARALLADQAAADDADVHFGATPVLAAILGNDAAERVDVGGRELVAPARAGPATDPTRR